jgi:hypothetical protein
LSATARRPLAFGHATKRIRDAPRVIVVWSEVPATRLEREQAARDIIQTVFAERQRRLDAPVLAGVRTAGAVKQARKPLSFSLSDKKIVAVEWADIGTSRLRVVTDTGETLEVDPHANTRARRSFVDVENPKAKRRRRKPAKVMVRPGSRRQLDRLDPTLGVESLLNQKILWMLGSAGARIAIVLLNPNGNAVGMGRLSGEDKNETMATQVEGLLALEQRHPELVFRYLILAVDMSGVRQVRQQSHIEFPEGTPERDDIIELDKFIQQGWVEHVAWWSEDRVARKVAPAHTIFERLRTNDVGLWFVVHGGQVANEEDDVLLSVMAIVASNDRRNTVRRLRTGALRKGALAGNGHLNVEPYGFTRTDTYGLVEIDDAWEAIHRMFELADVGLEGGGVGLSAPRIAEELDKEGFGFDHDRVRTILKDPIYATGEWSVKIGDIAIPQTPVKLKNPVPLDRFQRVQDWIALRGGGDENTPLGDFLFNCVETVHKRCMDLTGGANERPIRVRGYNLKHHKSQKLRHYPVTPECCKGKGRGKAGAWAWERELLERPVVEELRKLATHPEILRQAELAERHDLARTSARFTPHQREEIQRQRDALVQAREAASDRFVSSIVPGKTPDYDEFSRVDKSFSKQIDALQRRLDNDQAMAETERETPQLQASHGDRLDAFLEILTVERPEDRRMKALRARLFSLVVSRLIIDDEGQGPITVTVEGVLVPPGSPAEVANPLHAAGDFLDRYIREKHGQKGVEERTLERAEKVKTDFESSHSKSVSTVLLDLPKIPTKEEWRRLRRVSLSNQNWNLGRKARPADGSIVWSATVSLPVEAAAAAIPMNEAERFVLTALASTPIASMSQLAALNTTGTLRDSAISFGALSLANRGWVRTALASGGHSDVRVYSLAADCPLAPPEPSTGRVFSEGRAGRPPSAALTCGDTSVEQIPTRRRAQQRRRDRALLRAHESSLSVAEAMKTLRMTSDELIDGLGSGSFVAVVMPDGETRIPRWQFTESGAVRAAAAPLLAAAKELRIVPWTLHLLMTQPRDYGRKPSLESILAESDRGDTDARNVNAARVIEALAMNSTVTIRRRRRERAAS